MNKIKVDYTELEKYLTLSTSDLLKHLKLKFNKDGYVYINNNSNVLGIAHLDIVGDIKKSHCDIFQSAGIVFSRALDDRLGVFILLNILPKLGINLDVLLTDNEEIGQSTARYFKTKKSYNWMVEFDRHGVDAVTYQYRDFEKTLAKYFNMGIGSYSDIVELSNLGILGFNLGIGYYNEHTKNCFCDISQTKEQLYRFINFYNSNKNKKFAYTDNYYQFQYDNEIYGKYDFSSILYDDDFDKEVFDYCEYCNDDFGIYRKDTELFLCDRCYKDYRIISDIYFSED